MESHQLADYPTKTTEVHALAVENGDNGFADQPAYGEKYDPSHDKRGMSQSQCVALGPSTDVASLVRHVPPWEEARAEAPLQVL